MNGLVCGYGSDSDQEEDSATPSTNRKDNGSVKSSEKDWMECMDNTSGYPYYWNRETNEVKWDRPPEMGPPPIPSSLPVPGRPSTTALPVPSGPSKNSISNQQIKSTKNSSSKNEKSSSNMKTAIAKDPALENAIKKLKKSKSTKSKTPPEVFIGPTLPQLTPEEIARGKVIKFEESMAKDIEKDILKEEPIDWSKSKVHRGLYSKPFAWKKTPESSNCLSTYQDLQATLKKASQSISLIAGNYADDSETDEDLESPPKKKRHQGVHVKVQKPASKQSKPLLKDIPGIFKNNDDSDDDDNENDNATGDNNSEGKCDEKEKKRKRWDMKTYVNVNSSAERMCLKLEALEVAKIPISPLKLLAVQVETLFAAWQNGALSKSYLQTTLEKLSAQMLDIESHHLAPPGWRAVWDRYALLSRYYFFVLSTTILCAFFVLKINVKN